MQLQRDVGILGRIRGRILDAHLVEADLRRALAGDLGVGDRLHVEMAPREVVHVVRLVRFEHIGLEQRVVRDAGQREAVIGEHVLVVLDVLPELLRRGIGEPRREPRSTSSRASWSGAPG